MSIAGGLHRALESAQAVGCDCLQIFVKNQRQWTAKALRDEDIVLWREAVLRTGIGPTVAHATYLANLASGDRGLWNKSVAALTDELLRCQALGIVHLIFHPGAHLTATLERGIARIARGIDTIHKRTRGLDCTLLLETTAGQGTAIGHRFEHLAQIIERVAEPERLGICVDTCHVFAAGYPLIKPEDYEATVQELDDVVGIGRVKCLHVNDSKKELGSRVDRHEQIGQGQIGFRGFRNVVNDIRFRKVLKILETPKGVDQRGRDLDRINLGRLRRMIRG